MFGRKRRLEAENAELRQWLAHLGGMEAVDLAVQLERLRDELQSVRQQVETAGARLAQTNAMLVHADETAMLQEAGVYDFLHPLDDAVAYKSRLSDLQKTIKQMIKNGVAVVGTTHWQVNGSLQEGRRMVRDFSRLMLRAYNAEADKCVQTVRPARLPATIDRLGKVRESIARLGRTMSIQITDAYHAARLEEIRLTADYRAKQEEEKERLRAERERQREEAAAQREFEREKNRLAKERSHYRSALSRLRAQGDDEAVREMEAKLSEIETAFRDLRSREANIRAGYVYVISNVGSFGADVVKIGMTRRLEPENRVRELGDASVPFKFDTHALIF
ncbi:MAG TPA: DUF4041 domain-containing protein, partial [Actinopolymorphaceae bacterium]